MSRRRDGEWLAWPFELVGLALQGTLALAGRKERQRGVPNYQCFVCGRVGTRAFRQAKRRDPIVCESRGACAKRAAARVSS